MTWQPFEKFVAFYRCVKSIAYCEAPVDLCTLHAGARFGPTGGIGIAETKARKVVGSIKQYPTNSSAIAGGNSVAISTDDGVVEISKMDAVVINAPAGVILSLVQLVIGKQPIVRLCNEVLQCKLLQSKRKISAKIYDEEREKAVDQNVDVFLFITIAEADDSLFLRAAGWCQEASLPTISDYSQVCELYQVESTEVTAKKTVNE
ncbi:hypothetical protein ON010_g9667 [Phytophthora cinnamomi]|nr:hypothetical protein ON010_g9667 [Phytophthora cinnamomi]